MRFALLSLALCEILLARSDDTDFNSFTLTEIENPNLFLSIDQNGCYLKNCTGLQGCRSSLQLIGTLDDFTYNLTQVGTNFYETVQGLDLKNKTVKFNCTNGVDNTTKDHYYKVERVRRTI